MKERKCFISRKRRGLFVLLESLCQLSSWEAKKLILCVEERKQYITKLNDRKIKVKKQKGWESKYEWKKWKCFISRKRRDLFVLLEFSCQDSSWWGKKVIFLSYFCESKITKYEWKKWKKHVKTFFISRKSMVKKGDICVVCEKTVWIENQVQSSCQDRSWGEKKNQFEFFSGKPFESKFKLNQHFRANHKENKTPIKVEDNKHNKAAKIWLFSKSFQNSQIRLVTLW